MLSETSTSPSLRTPPPLSANVWKLILTFQVFRKAARTGDNRCGAWGPSVLGRERVNGPCVTVCICYIFYSPLFKLILEAQHLPNLHRVSGFSSSAACLRVPFLQVLTVSAENMQRLSRFLGTKVSKPERIRSFRTA